MIRSLTPLLGLSLLLAACSGLDLDGFGRHSIGDDDRRPTGVSETAAPTGGEVTPSIDPDTVVSPSAPGPGTSPALITDPFVNLPATGAQLAVLCARGAHDAVTKAFCGSTPAPVSSLKDLLSVLDLHFKDTADRALNGAGNNAAFALLAHSTSLVTRAVSAANPRAIIMSRPKAWKIEDSLALDASKGMAPPNGWNPPHTPDQSSWSKPSTWTPPTADQTLSTWPPGAPGAWGSPSSTVAQVDSTSSDSGYCVVSYARGENLVEIAAHDSSTKRLNLYLVKFDSGVTQGGLYTPLAEQGWSNVTVYGDKDLENTIVDCTHCHRLGSSGTRNILRMQEMGDPWTHWMSPWTAGGAALLSDFRAVHGKSEDYAGIPSELLAKSEPRTLELLVRNNGFVDQPNAFPARSIEKEVKASAPDQPSSNAETGSSSTWQSIYEAGATGAFVAAPHHDVKVADPSRFETAKAQYASFRATGDATTAPVLADLFSDASAVTMGLTPPSSAGAEQVLVQACAECHRGAADPSLSRSRFDATDLGAMTASEKAVAAARLVVPVEDIRHMPPSRSKVLTPAQVAALQGLLK